MKKKTVSMVLAFVLALGLVPTAAVAYTTPDFSDLPADNWAYAPVMRMADQGIIQGTGNGEFSPELKVSVAQFLTLVGRIVFPETAVGANDTWYGPYVAAAQNGGLLTGTQVDTNNVEAEISRYDMAVILRAAAKKLGKTETLAQSSQVTDYGMVPTMYAEAVLAVYGMGLIKGDQAGNFNGANTMQRNELATVIDRLVELKTPGGTTDPGTTTEPEKPVESEKPTTVTTEAKYAHFAEAGCAPRRDYDPSKVERVEGTDLRIDRSYRSPEIIGTPYAGYVYFHVGDTFQFTLKEVPGGYGYSEGDLNERVQYWLDQMTDKERASQSKYYTNGIWLSSNPSVATVDENGVVTIVGPGEASIDAHIPVIYYRDAWTQMIDSIPICADP